MASEGGSRGFTYIQYILQDPMGDNEGTRGARGLKKGLKMGLTRVGVAITIKSFCGPQKFAIAKFEIQLNLFNLTIFYLIANFHGL